MRLTLKCSGPRFHVMDQIQVKRDIHRETDKAEEGQRKKENKKAWMNV